MTANSKHSWDGATAPNRSLGDFVDDFETVRRRSPVANLRDYAPPTTDSGYLQTLCELARVDIEYRWASGDKVELSFYREQYPELFEEPSIAELLRNERNRQSEKSVERTAMLKFGFEVGNAPDRLSPDRELKCDRLPNVGAHVFDFELIAELGRGTFAKTFLARQSGLSNRPVVVKLTRQELGEPSTLARLQHTNIAPIYSVHRGDGITAICMPYHGATTFADVLRGLRDAPTQSPSLDFLVSTIRNRYSTVVDGAEAHCPKKISEDLQPRRMSQMFATEWMPLVKPFWVDRDYVWSVLWLHQKLAEGLQHAHERGVLHEDIKPANLLLGDDGQPLLIDFNLSRVRHGNLGELQGELGGTLPYMAPEKLWQLRGRELPVDERSDIYSLGVVLAELLGTPPVSPPANLLLHEQIDFWLMHRVRSRATCLQQFSGVTPAVSAIVSKCLEHDAAKRYATARQLAEDLGAHLVDLPLIHAREPSLRERLLKWRRRNPRLTVALQVGAVSIALLGTVGGVSARLSRELQAATTQNLLSQGKEVYRGFLSTKDDIDCLLAVASGRIDAARQAALLGEEAVKAWDGAYFSLETNNLLSTVKQGSALTFDELELAELCFTMAECRMQLARNAASQEETSRERGIANNWHHRAKRLFKDSASGILEHQARALNSLNKVGEQPDDFTMSQFAKNRPLEMHLYAKSLLQRGRFGEAVPWLEKAAHGTPDRFSYWLDLGYAYYQRGRFPEAVSAYSVSLALRPNASPVYFVRGLAHQKQGALDEALADFARTLVGTPGDYYARLHHGMVQLELNRFKESIDDFTQLIDADQLTCWSLLLRQRAYKQLGELDRASRDRSLALSLKPSEEGSWIMLALEQMDENPEAALESLTQALALNPFSREAFQNKAHLLSEILHRDGDAVDCLTEALKLDDGYVPALGGRAVLLARLGEREKAHRDAQACLSLDRSPFTLYQLAGVFAQTSRRNPEDVPKALELASLALSVDPKISELVASDKDIDPLKSNPEFMQAVARARANLGPPAAEILN